MATNPKNFAIERNSFQRRDCDIARLPFVRDVKVGPRRTERKFWCVPEVDCYGEANAIGAMVIAPHRIGLRCGQLGDVLYQRRQARDNQPVYQRLGVAVREKPLRRL